MHNLYVKLESSLHEPSLRTGLEEVKPLMLETGTFQLDGQGPSWRLSLNRLMTVYSDQSFGFLNRITVGELGSLFPVVHNFYVKL